MPPTHEELPVPAPVRGPRPLPLPGHGRAPPVVQRGPRPRGDQRGRPRGRPRPAEDPNARARIPGAPLRRRPPRRRGSRQRRADAGARTAGGAPGRGGGGHRREVPQRPGPLSLEPRASWPGEWRGCTPRASTPRAWTSPSPTRSRTPRATPTARRSGTWRRSAHGSIPAPASRWPATGNSSIGGRIRSPDDALAEAFRSAPEVVQGVIAYPRADRESMRDQLPAQERLPRAAPVEAPLPGSRPRLGLRGRARAGPQLPAVRRADAAGALRRGRQSLRDVQRLPRSGRRHPAAPALRAPRASRGAAAEPGAPDGHRGREGDAPPRVESRGVPAARGADRERRWLRPPGAPARGRALHAGRLLREGRGRVPARELRGCRGGSARARLAGREGGPGGRHLRGRLRSAGDSLQRVRAGRLRPRQPPLQHPRGPLPAAAGLAPAVGGALHGGLRAPAGLRAAAHRLLPQAAGRGAARRRLARARSGAAGAGDPGRDGAAAEQRAGHRLRRDLPRLSLRRSREGAAAPRLPALPEPQRHGSDAEEPGAAEARRGEARAVRALQRHPRLHHPLRAHVARGAGEVRQRLPHPDDEHRLRGGRHAGQVHRRCGDGLLGRARGAAGSRAAGLPHRDPHAGRAEDAARGVAVAGPAGLRHRRGHQHRAR